MRYTHPKVLRWLAGLSDGLAVYRDGSRFSQPKAL
jgi:hypothetical protein